MKYEAAYNEAVRLANLTGRETGIEKLNEFGRTVRRGWELRCRVVRPGEPEIETA